MTYLNIPFNRFKTAYDDYRFIPLLSQMGTKTVLEYLSWADATNLLKEHYPELAVDYERDKDTGSYIYKTTNYIVEETREVFKQLILEKQSLLESTKDWKEQNKLKTEIKDLQNQLNYNNRGFYILPYLICNETGKRTPPLLFPIMDHNNDSIYNPDSRDINDSCQRGQVKAIAVYSGVGLRAYTREDAPPDTKDAKGLFKDSPKWKRIIPILEVLNLLEKNVDYSLVNLGKTEKQLEQLVNKLYDEYEALLEAKKNKE